MRKTPRKTIKATFLATAVAVSAGLLSLAPPMPAEARAQHSALAVQMPQSVNVLKFGEGNTLFLGDSSSATLFAYEAKPQNNPQARSGYNLHNLSAIIADFARVSPLDIRVRDMAIHPVSKEAYIAFDTKTTSGYRSQIVVLNQAGDIRGFDLQKTLHTQKQFHDAPTDDVKFWGKTPMRSLTFTDIDFHQGKVYVSGMSNAEFSSALRIVDYPFRNTPAASASVEIFHAVHNQNETRAPIQTLTFVKLNNEDYILAAYTCTPLVLIPVKALQDGAHVVGKTIAEMGYGNTPIDLVSFKSMGMDKKPYEGVLLSNRNRSAHFVDLKDITESSKQPSIGPVGMAGSAGTPFQKLPMTSLLQLDDQDEMRLATLRRNDETGSLELLSFMKNVYLRLDEFISEYDQPSYVYASEQAQMKGLQNMLIKDLGQEKFMKP